ncbi:MAG: outer membrane lipoprotein-sorting protein [Verrucomicrobiales bacterium]|nr:outer membrane lipoprotein-sorting protein [Verrucomicrobiales bacterium]
MIAMRQFLGIFRVWMAVAWGCAVSGVVIADDASMPLRSAAELAGQLAGGGRQGSAFVRLRVEVRQLAAKSRLVLQVQVKSRRSPARTELVYQVLWPKERKGEAILLTRVGGAAPSGTRLVPPSGAQPMAASAFANRLFGTDLLLADLIEEHFGWKHQNLAGTEEIDGIRCDILESRPGKGEWAGCATVRSWIDPRRLVPMRIEKYSSSGQLLRRIDTLKVVRQDGWHFPARFLVRQSGQDSESEFEAVRGERGVTFADEDFTAQGLGRLDPPRSGGE